MRTKQRNKTKYFFVNLALFINPEFSMCYQMFNLPRQPLIFFSDKSMKEKSITFFLFNCNRIFSTGCTEIIDCLAK